MVRALQVVALVGALAARLSAEPIALHTQTCGAVLDRGVLCGLEDAGHHLLMESRSGARGIAIRCQDRDYLSGPSSPPALVSRGRVEARIADFAGLPDASALASYRADPATGDVVVELRCRAGRTGVAGVEWAIGPIPRSMNVIVPGYGGVKLTAQSATTAIQLEYPMFWEAQFVILEGAGRGFYVWSDDCTGRFKRLTVTLEADGWWIGLTTWNDAPFDALESCRSARWRVNVYEGDWRVPARRYRDWLDRNAPVVGAPAPAWVHDIRAVAVLFNGPSIETAEMLAERLDPTQTLLYVPDWRPAGYDRMYPDYDGVPEFGAFVRRAHDLGFRVMPHLNYFACDPQHPLYAEFDAHQVRDAWGSHERQWFVWTDASNPANNRKLAYINPAYAPWRRLMVERIRTLVQTYGVDAVYLDQTLNTFNDYGGRTDGLNMLQGNLALGREIREALPGLAVGGECLNEVTRRYQVFCQRHAWGVDFDRGTWNKPQLTLAHPISTYLFRPAALFHYIGCPPPGRAQYYAAWRENYARWGAVPTLMLSDARADEPTGFSRQLWDEVRYWQQARLSPDLDGPWPADTVFPYRTARHRPAARTADGRLAEGERVVSRTVTGVTEVRMDGAIEGALCYDGGRIFGLSPDVWYPAFAGARDLSALHVESLPPGMELTDSLSLGDIAVLTTHPPVLAALPGMVDQATTRSEPFAGAPREVQGALNGADGSQFAAIGDRLHAHPPWRAGAGRAMARWSIALPHSTGLRFTSRVALDTSVVGQSDGVLFAAAATAGSESVHAEVFSADAEEQLLELDLSRFAGRQIVLELSVDPGPRHDVTGDWARWIAPRVETATESVGEMLLVDPGRGAVVLTGTEALLPSYSGSRGRAPITCPGATVILRDPPPPTGLPQDLLSASPRVVHLDGGGQPLTSPPWASARVGTGTVGEVARPALAVQPPDRGRTVAAYPLQLPTVPAELRCLVGLEDGSTSTGVDFILTMNWAEVARIRVLPGQPWRTVAVDLTPWAGKPVLLGLVTDSDGPYDSDWARWGEPAIRPRG